MLEALVVGVLGATVGLGLGVLLALAIRELFGTVGLDDPWSAGHWLRNCAAPAIASATPAAR